VGQPPDTGECIRSFMRFNLNKKPSQLVLCLTNGRDISEYCSKNEQLKSFLKRACVRGYKEVPKLQSLLLLPVPKGEYETNYGADFQIFLKRDLQRKNVSSD